MGFCGSSVCDHAIEDAIAAAHQVAGMGADLLLLPEEFAGTTPQPSPGRLTTTLGAEARRHKMYIAFGMRELDLATNRTYNSVVVLDRWGAVVGRPYRKLFPCCPPPSTTKSNNNENLWPGNTGITTHDLDFGRVGILTCFDANYPEVWHAVYAARADLVLWPSAYGGGMPLRAYSMLYKYPIVPNGWGDIIDNQGRVVDGLVKTNSTGTSRSFPITLGKLDLDDTYFHHDYNDKLDQVVKDHNGLISAIDLEETNATILKRTDAGWKQGVSVRDLISEYDLESLRDYQIRARRVINLARQDGAILD
jgi:hypothetical protein